MQKDLNFGTASLLVAGLVLTVLTIVPDVGWMIRQQARILVGGRITPVTNPPNQRENQVLRDNPNDYLLQVGGAFQRTDTDEEWSEDNYNAANRLIVTRLQALQTRFPNEPSLSGHILRYLCTNRLLNHRKELPRPPRGFGPQPQFGPPGSSPEPETTDPATLAHMVSIAEQGEVLDPSNAFFPTVQAIACFAQGRDAEARNALTRAATKPRWDDYASEEIQARWKLLTGACGEMSALQKFALLREMHYTHPYKIRSMMQIAAAQAADWERQGKTGEGLALRKSFARLSARIRADSPSASISLYGGRMALIAASRPGGSPDDEAGDYNRRDEITRDGYIAYLYSIGATDEACWIREEVGRLEKAEAIHRRAMDMDWEGAKEPRHLARQWWAGVLLLLNALWILFLGGLAVLLAQTRRIREGHHLSQSMFWGFAYTLVGPLLLHAICHLVNILSVETELLVYTGVPLLACLLVFPVFWLKRGTDWRGYGRNIGAFLATAAASITLVWLFPLSLRGIQWADLTRSNFNSDHFSFHTLMASTPLSDLLAGEGITAYYLLHPGLLPALCVIGLAVWSWRRKVPVSVGIVRGFQRMSLPLASLLLLIYAFLIVFTFGSEIEVAKSIDERARHEGRYEAKIIGEVWPGSP